MVRKMAVTGQSQNQRISESEGTHPQGSSKSNKYNSRSEMYELEMNTQVPLFPTAARLRVKHKGKRSAVNAVALHDGRGC